MSTKLTYIEREAHQNVDIFAFRRIRYICLRKFDINCFAIFDIYAPCAYEISSIIKFPFLLYNSLAPKAHIERCEAPYIESKTYRMSTELTYIEREAHQNVDIFAFRRIRYICLRKFDINCFAIFDIYALCAYEISSVIKIPSFSSIQLPPRPLRRSPPQTLPTLRSRSFRVRSAQGYRALFREPTALL